MCLATHSLSMERPGCTGSEVAANTVEYRLSTTEHIKLECALQGVRLSIPSAAAAA